MRVILSLLFLVNIIYASVAVVSAFNGSANIYRDNQKLKVYIGIEINEKDTIKTNNNTKIQLIFKDNTRITIGKNSQFSVSDYLYDETKPNASKAKFKFTKGLFRTISGRIGKLNKKQFKISVKSATIGIRGTKFDVLVTASFVKVGVYKGTVYFENLGEIVDIKEDHFFVYEYLNNKKIIKQGRLKESFEFKDDNKQGNKLSNNIDIDPILTTTNINTNDVRNQVEDIIDSNNNIKNTLVKEVIGSLSDLDYGYWQDPLNDNKRVDTFIEGTSVEKVINSNGGISAYGNTASYSGDIASIVTDANGIKKSSSGTINLNMDFDNQSLSGDIDINTGEYKGYIETGYSSTSSFFTDTIVDNSGNIAITGGKLDGKFYGDGAGVAAGTFSLTGEDSSKVEGVFAVQE